MSQLRMPMAIPQHFPCPAQKSQRVTLNNGKWGLMHRWFLLPTPLGNVLKCVLGSSSDSARVKCPVTSSGYQPNGAPWMDYPSRPGHFPCSPHLNPRISYLNKPVTQLSYLKLSMGGTHNKNLSFGSERGVPCCSGGKREDHGVPE